ncbi:MAG TPA: enoyl-CoA hydratase-related protein [Chitinophagales bacterium]|nr:enoyl-CoA hydratase-related protein [Chitinophagales bacterium]
MNFETLTYQEEGQIAILTINRPQALNALNDQVLNDLKEFTKQIKKSENIRALIITGAGEKAFVAGADIKAMQGMTPQEAEKFARKAQDIFDSIEALPIAVIAAVNGFALGGGCEFAMTCNIILASEKAKFGLPEVTLGLLPSFGGTQRLPRAVGLYKANEMIFSGEFYTAQQAKDMGLVNRVYAPEELMNEAKKLANTIASRAPIAIAKAKKSIYKGLDLPIDKGLKKEAQLFGKLFSTKDSEEGINAFVEKRKADFKNI